MSTVCLWSGLDPSAGSLELKPHLYFRVTPIKSKLLRAAKIKENLCSEGSFRETAEVSERSVDV